MFKRLFSMSRVRTARRKLAREASVANYVCLAHEYGVLGKLEHAVRVSKEGLDAYPGSSELRQVRERSLRLLRQGRARDLQQELKQAPRPAVYRELCEIYLESGELKRADALAQDWYSSTEEGEALFLRGAVWTKRFFADRRRSDARKALEFLRNASEEMPEDERPLRTEFQILSRCGAWRDARQVMVKLLELCPGDPVLEARFRRMVSDGAGAPTLDQALMAVERTGILSDEEPEAVSTQSTTAIRPILQELVGSHGASMALYVQGGTALIQGPKGATAERTARSVREIAKSSQSTARRIGLGQVTEVRLEGEFGELVIHPGDLGIGAIWSEDKITKRHVDGLKRLARLHHQKGDAA